MIPAPNDVCCVCDGLALDCACMPQPTTQELMDDLHRQVVALWLDSLGIEAP